MLVDIEKPVLEPVILAVGGGAIALVTPTAGLSIVQYDAGHGLVVGRAVVVGHVGEDVAGAAGDILLVLVLEVPHAVGIDIEVVDVDAGIALDMLAEGAQLAVGIRVKFISGVLVVAHLEDELEEAEGVFGHLSLVGQTLGLHVARLGDVERDEGGLLVLEGVCSALGLAQHAEPLGAVLDALQHVANLEDAGQVGGGIVHVVGTHGNLWAVFAIGVSRVPLGGALRVVAVHVLAAALQLCGGGGLGAAVQFRARGEAYHPAQFIIVEELVAFLYITSNLAAV